VTYDPEIRCKHCGPRSRVRTEMVREYDGSKRLHVTCGNCLRHTSYRRKPLEDHWTEIVPPEEEGAEG
jgi:uncharacterized Zn finger protein